MGRVAATRSDRVRSLSPRLQLSPHARPQRHRVTLTASTELEYAFEEAESGASVSELGASPPGSIFTRFLVEGINTGAADANADGEISIDELYDFVYAKVREHSPQQTPGKGGGDYGDLIIAHGRKASLQLEVRQALDNALRALLDGLGHCRPRRRPRPPSSNAPSSWAHPLRRRRGIIAGALAVALAGVIIAVVASLGGSNGASGSNGSSGSSTINLPPNPARGIQLGSDLTPTDLETCFGPNESCSVVQYARWRGARRRRSVTV